MVGSPTINWYSTPLAGTVALWLGSGVTGALFWFTIDVHPMHLECDPVWGELQSFY